MSFDSLTYFLFLPAVLALHWLCPARCRWIVLLAASYVFYASWNVSLSLLILGVTGVTYLAGRLIESASPRRRRLYLAVSLAVCLGVLGYFKYFNLLGEALAAVSGRAWRAVDILLPVGVSFYTFQALSYVIDVYRGNLRPERHFGYYALYISFFPQLVAGPIERAGALIPQLRQDRRLTAGDVSAGLKLVLSGLFRKLVVADLAAPFVNTVYKAPQPDGSAVLIATLLFGIQIYCDFSGYSEIAAGSARLLGVRLMRNFDRPYAAKSIREFWRKWHISLTVWFTDYVYIPLGGSRKGLPRQLFATVAVFALCGLWHGADWSFLVWGLFHACLMIADILLWRGSRAERFGRLRRCLMLAGVCFAWLFFRAENMAHAVRLLGRLFSPWAWTAGSALLTSAVPGVPPAVLMLLLLCALLIVARLPALAYQKSTQTSDIVWACLLMAVVAAALIRIDSGAANAFIYFQF